MLYYYLGGLCIVNAQNVLRDKNLSPACLQGTNGGQYFGKHPQMHGKCGKQKKGRENTLT